MIGKPAIFRRSARLQAKGSPNMPNTQAPPTEPLQESFQTPQDLSATKQRKGSRCSENDRPGKLPGTDLQVISSVRKPLSEHNLQTHNRLLIDPEIDTSRGGRRTRRQASRTRTESSHSTSTITQESTSVRWNHQAPLPIIAGPF